MPTTQVAPIQPLPDPPSKYDPVYEANRNRVINQNLLIISAVNRLYGTSINLSMLPTSPTGLRSGDVWQDPANSHQLKLVP